MAKATQEAVIYNSRLSNEGKVIPGIQVDRDEQSFFFRLFSGSTNPCTLPLRRSPEGRFPRVLQVPSGEMFMVSGAARTHKDNRKIKWIEGHDKESALMLIPKARDLHFGLHERKWRSPIKIHAGGYTCNGPFVQVGDASAGTVSSLLRVDKGAPQIWIFDLWGNVLLMQWNMTSWAYLQPSKLELGKFLVSRVNHLSLIARKTYLGWLRLQLDELNLPTLWSDRLEHMRKESSPNVARFA